LHYAALDGNADKVSELIANGLDPCAADDDGWTPLHFAAQSGSIPACVALLDARARVDARDLNGNSPLFRAVFCSRGRGEVIRLLRERGADPKLINKHGVSPLSLAATIGNYDVRQFFVDLPE